MPGNHEADHNNDDQRSGAEDLPVSATGWKHAVPQVLASCIAFTLVIHPGLSLAYSDIILSQLLESGSSFNISQAEGSWIASLVSAGTLIGSLVIGPLMDKLGRKATCKLCCVPLAAAWALVAVANNVNVLYAGRMLAGIGAGLTTVSVVYVSEVSHARLRPMLLCLNSVFVSFGILLACLLGQWMTWRGMAVFFTCMALASCLAMCSLPESPPWLSWKKRDRAGDKTSAKIESALRWLHRHPQYFESELQKLTNANNERRSTTYKAVLDSLSTFISPSVWKPVLIMLIMFFFQQMSGGYITIIYSVHIFHLIGGKFGAGINQYNALVLLGFVRFAMSVATALLSLRVGRKPLLIFSGMGMCVSMLVLAVCLQINPFSHPESGFMDLNAPRNASTSGNEEEQEHWMPLLSFLIYVCAGSLGVLVIPWIMVGELLPLHVRGVGGGLLVGLSYTMMFVTVKTFPYVLSVFQTSTIFYFFGISSLGGALLVYFFVPETFGKTLQEIEKHFKREQ